MKIIEDTRLSKEEFLRLLKQAYHSKTQHVF